MTILTIKQAKKIGMEPLTVPMKKDDPGLETIYRDMQSVAGTNWALVQEGVDAFAVWRVPSPLRFTYADGSQPRPSRKIASLIEKAYSQLTES